MSEPSEHLFGFALMAFSAAAMSGNSVQTDSPVAHCEPGN